MKLVVTTVGKDCVGIIAKVSKVLAENQVNVLSINQNIMEGFFNMVMIAEMADAQAGQFTELQKLLRAAGEEIGVAVKAQHEEIFNIMHKI